VKYHHSLLAVALLTLSGNVIAQDCRVNVTPMAFGHMEPTDGVAVDSVADISVTCDKPTPFLVRLDAGQHSSDTLTRVMRLVGGVATLHYNLFLDASRTLTWGDGSGGGSTFSGISSGVGENTPVYGRIYGGQSPPPGSYVDSVTVIVEW
jgi:spore coat protein U-like protein